MAKPGSNGARQIAARGVDLAARKARASMTEEEAAGVQEAIEERLGARCDGCGRRIAIGFRFTSLNPRSERPVLNLSACTREDCGFAELAREGATFMEAVEFVWLDDAGKDARPAPAIVEVAKRREAALASRGAEA